MITPVVSAVVVVVPGDPRGGLDDGPRRLQRRRCPFTILVEDVPNCFTHRG